MSEQTGFAPLLDDDDDDLPEVEPIEEPDEPEEEPEKPKDKENGLRSMDDRLLKSRTILIYGQIDIFVALRPLDTEEWHRIIKRATQS